MASNEANYIGYINNNLCSISGSSDDQGGQSEFCGNENFNGRTQKRFTSKLSGLAL